MSGREIVRYCKRPNNLLYIDTSGKGSPLSWLILILASIGVVAGLQPKNQNHLVILVHNDVDVEKYQP